MIIEPEYFIVHDDVRKAKVSILTDKIERKIEKTFDRIHLYELKGKQTSMLEEQLEILNYLLHFIDSNLEVLNYLSFRKLFDDIFYNDPDDSSNYDLQNNNSLSSTHHDLSEDNIASIKNVSSESIANLETNNFLNNGLDDWLDRNTKLGTLGEKIALHYLHQNVLTEIKSVSHITSKGYDLEGLHEDKTIGYEVKTSQSIKGFHITLNELKTALTMGNNYNIFYIIINPVEKNVYGLIIPNPIKQLGINYEHISKLLHTNNGSIHPIQFFYTFSQDFIEGTEKLLLMKTIEINSEWIE